MQKERDLLKLAQEELAQKTGVSNEVIQTRQSELDTLAHTLKEREYELSQREKALREASWELDARQNEASVQTEILQVRAQEEHKPFFAPTMTDLVEKAQAERIRLNTSGTMATAQYRPQTVETTVSKPDSRTYNKGLTVFKAALLTFCIILAESLAVFFLKDQLQVSPWYAVVPFSIGFVFFGICGLIYASGYKPQAHRKKKPTYFINAVIFFIIGAIIVSMIAVYCKAELTIANQLFSYVLVPVIFLANIIFFAIFFHLFSKAKQTKK